MDKYAAASFSLSNRFVTHRFGMLREPTEMEMAFAITCKVAMRLGILCGFPPTPRMCNHPRPQQLGAEAGSLQLPVSGGTTQWEVRPSASRPKVFSKSGVSHRGSR